jgi:hypothetical protein
MNNEERKDDKQEGSGLEENGVCRMIEPDLDDDDFRYDPMPPQRVVTYKVRIKVVGRGEPLPYPFDEEDDE